MVKQTEIATEIDALATQTNKILTEVTVATDSLRAEIVALEEQLATASENAIPALEASVANLKVILQTLDDVNPDA